MVDVSKFFNNLTSFLVKDLSFVAHPYDVCVVNKSIEGKECTITCHAEYLKISHKDASVVTSTIK